MPRVSVVIPVYNVQDYLPLCLESVLKQTFADFEVICVNDGSSDEGALVLSDYAAKDSRIKIITQPNQGLSAARNRGLAEASGEFVYFLDSDDAVHPQLLEICCQLAQQHQADLINFAYQSFQGLSLPPHKIYSGISELLVKIESEPLLANTKGWSINYNVWSKFYRRNLLKEHSFIPGIFFEDYPFCVTLLARHPRTVLINEKLYFYRTNNSSITRSPFTVKKVNDYQTGLNFVYDNCHSFKDSRINEFLIRNLVPDILKHQYNGIRRSPKALRAELWQAFRAELQDLQNKGWLQQRGHKLLRYWFYRWLLRQK